MWVYLPSSISCPSAQVEGDSILASDWRFQALDVVEIEAYACEVLASRMEEGNLDAAPIWTDLRTFDGRPWRGVVDCVAGRMQGADDPRHLWPEVARIVREVQPAFCFFENVGNHLRIGFREVAGELHAMGYRVAAGLFTASEVGAIHKRERLFILAARADADYSRLQGRGAPTEEPRSREQFERLVQAVARISLPAGATGGMVDGARNRMDRLRICGNGVYPRTAALALVTLLADLEGCGVG